MAQLPTAPGAQPTAPAIQVPSATPGTPTPGSVPVTYNNNGPGVLPNGTNPGTTPVAPGIATQGVPFTPATAGAGGAFVPNIPGTFLTTVPVNAQFHRLYGGLNLVPPTAVPVGTARPVLAPVSPATSTTPWTWSTGYNRNGPGVLAPNGGLGNLAPTALATPPAGSAFFAASPGTAMTIASVNPQFNRLFSGLSAGVAAAQSSPGAATPGYNSDGPGVVPNGSGR